MPNWCDNVITISHKDKQAIKRVRDAFQRGELCDEFIPIPNGLRGESGVNLTETYGYSSWYDFCVQNWGTKWDIGKEGSIDKDEDNSISVTFSSAWCPPMGLYRTLVNLGYEVIAYYAEEGAGFIGKFTNEDGDEIYDYPTNSTESIPSDIDEVFSVMDQIKMWEDENTVANSD